MTPEWAAIRLVIVEDDEHLLASLAKIMALQADIHVVGAYGCTEEAMEQTDWSAVDVLLADLGLPGVSGVDLIAAATLQNPQHLHTLVHTIHDDRKSLFAALRAGAIGYVIKGLPALETIEAVRAVSQGASSLSPSIAHFLIEAFRSSAINTEETLTPREIELLNLSAQGLVYKQIGEQLAISSGTVHSHIKRIYRKLQASNREQALHRAEVLGYLKQKDKTEF